MDQYKPPFAQVFHMGSWYKLGVTGLVFRWNGGEWVRSTKPVREIKAAIDAAKFITPARRGNCC